MAGLVFLATDRDLKLKLSQFNLPETVFVTPTDTVYGLGTAIHNLAGVQRIQELKGRPRQDFIFLAPTIEQLERYCRLEPKEKSLLNKFWPGPISFVLREKGTGAARAWRVPRVPFLLDLMEWIGSPIVSTSCNDHGGVIAKNVEEAVQRFGDQIDFYLDGGELAGVPSTLVDMTVVPPKVLRRGAVQFQLC